MACSCVRSELDIFSPIKYQTSIDSSSYSTIYPISTLTSNVVEFALGKTPSFFDPSSTLLHTQLRVQHLDGTATVQGEDFFPLNNIGQSLWADCEVFFNTILVSNTNGLYATKAYMECLTGFGSDAKKTRLAANGYYHDANPVARQSDGVDISDGIFKRAALASENKLIDLVGPLSCDVFNGPNLLLNQIEVRIRLTKSRDNFIIMKAVANNNLYKVTLVACTLLVRHVTLSVTASLAIEKTLASNSARYHITRAQMRSWAISAGNTSMVRENLFQGKIPSRVTFVMVDSGALVGNWGLNPHHFQSFGLSEIIISVNGIPKMPIKLSADDFAVAYYTQFLAYANDHSNFGVDIPPNEFLHNFVLSWDLTPDSAASDDVRSANMVGNLRVEMLFSAALGRAVTVVCYGEMDGTIAITAARAIERDYI